MSTGTPLFTFRLTRVVLDRLGLSPREAAALLAEVGFPATAAEQPCTVPLSRVRALLGKAATLSRDPYFGLSLASSVPEGTYEEAELLVRTAPTVGAGLAALVKHASLVNPIGQFRYTEGQTIAELHYTVAGQRDGLGVHMNEYTLAYVLRGLRLVAMGPIPLTRAWCAHERSEPEQVEAYLGCPVDFGAPTTGYAFALEVARRPLGSEDPVVFDFLSRRAEQSLAAGHGEPFSLSIARAIEQELGFERASLGAIARHLGVTERTAQRRLRDAGTQFRDILEQARARRAAELVKKGVDDAQIAAHLGFADTATYRRAMKRWCR